MNRVRQRVLGFFSGFPSRRFPPGIARQLSRVLTERGSLVFVSAWPEDYERNDRDLAGMYEMFLEYGISFEQNCVIDSRMEGVRAAAMIQKASCIFLMGGHPGLQIQMMRDKGLDAAIRGSQAAILGVSAGAINMAERSLDTKESPVPYAGLGLADITVKPHFAPEDGQLLSTLLRISMELPICALEDDSAIFVEEAGVSHIGNIHWVDKGEIGPFSSERLLIPGKS